MSCHTCHLMHFNHFPSRSKIKQVTVKEGKGAYYEVKNMLKVQTYVVMTT